MNRRVKSAGFTKACYLIENGLFYETILLSSVDSFFFFLLYNR